MPSREQMIKFLSENQPAGQPSRAEMIDFLSKKDAPPKMIEETHPDISVWDRLKVKNFSNSQESSLRYLREEYPRLQIDLVDGRIGIKKSGEKDYKALDPSGMELADLGDIAYDVGSGVVEGLGTAAAGVAGAGAGGIGAIPAAMGAGAALSAGTEAARQGIGRAMGINEEFSGTDVGIATVLGGASPLLLGTGAGAKQLLKAGVKEGTQRGIVGRGYQGLSKKIAPKLAETFSGARAGGLTEYAKDPARIKQIAENPIDYAHEVAEEFGAALTRKQNSLKNRFSQMRDADNLVDLAPVKNELKQDIDKLKNIAETGGLNAQKRERLQGLIDAYDEAFNLTDLEGNLIKEMDSFVDFETAMDIKSSLKEVGKGGNTIFDKTKQSERTMKRLESGTLTGAFAQLNNSIDEAFGEGSKQLRGEWSKMMDQKKTIEKTLTGQDAVGADRAYDTLLKYGKGKQGTKVQQQLAPIAKSLDLNLDKRAGQMQASQEMINPSWVPISGQGVVSTGRIALTAALGAQMANDTRTGAGLGIMGGSMLASPRAMRSVIRGMHKTGQMPMMPAQGQQSLWNMFQSGQQQ